MKVKGVDKLLKQLEAFGKDGAKLAAGETEAAARDISATAVRNAPANFGKLRQGIQPEKISKLTWEVQAMAAYSGYVEFGTGAKVSVPKEMQDQAQAIKNQSKGNIDDALDSIKDWCRAKGIDERAAWPILMSILDEGLRPRPYLWPAFKVGSEKFVKNLNNAIDILTKKLNSAK